jgi:thiol-disulfide isomerase/thioredoxin
MDWMQIKVWNPSMKRTRFFVLVLLVGISTTVFADSFNLKDIQGKTQQLKNYRGKWVLVNFFATWCSPCLEEIPELNVLHAKHNNKDLAVIGIAIDSGDSKQISNFVMESEILYPVVMGDYRSANQFGEVNALPTSYLYNPGGELIGYQYGAITSSQIENYISEHK